MANPSHSTASPEPRNPQDDAQLDSRVRGNDSEAKGNDGGGENPEETFRNPQSVIPADAGIHDNGGLDARLHGHDCGEGNPDQQLDRRTLLTGAAAAAAAAGAAGAGLATAGMPGLDPVVAVYRRLLKLQADPLNEDCDEDDPAYMRLCYAIDDADDALVLTRATSTDGVRAKFARLAYLHHGGPERAIRDCELAHSIIADFAHLLARRAL